MTKIDPNSNILYEKTITENIISLFEKNDKGYTLEELQQYLRQLPALVLITEDCLNNTLNIFMDIMGKAGMIIYGQDGKYYKAIYGKRIQQAENNKRKKEKRK